MPSRVHPGEFYALPQSPQIFKQILMIAGMDKYVQIARCFRDEALRADRQLEFTQVDLEMAFARPEMVFEVVEGALAAALPRDRRRDRHGRSAACPTPRRSRVYGSDKPDLRFDLKIQDVGAHFAESPFGIFREAVEHGGTVRGFVIPGAAARRAGSSTSWASWPSRLGAPAWSGHGAPPTACSRRPRPSARPGITAVLDAMGAGAGDLVVLASGAADATSKMLGQLRLAVARKRNLIPEGRWELLWVTDFPLFVWNADERRWDSVNHPFTAPARGGPAPARVRPRQGAGQGL